MNNYNQYCRQMERYSDKTELTKNNEKQDASN